MSVAAYLWTRAGELRMAEGDLAGRVEGAVLEGKLSVENALDVAAGTDASRVWRSQEARGSVADYDPVLRCHCRLDDQG